MSPSTQKKMRRIEIFTGLALSANVIVSLYSYLNYTVPELYVYGTVPKDIFFSTPEAFMLTLPFFSLLLVSILFIVGKFSNSPARYITGTLFALTALSYIWQIARKMDWIILFYEDINRDCKIVCDLIFAAGSLICSLSYFGIIRFRKKKEQSYPA